MTPQFINRVLRDRVRDTRNYRYCVFEVNGREVIKRIILDALDTTAALKDASGLNPDGWVTVWTDEE